MKQKEIKSIPFWDKSQPLLFCDTDRSIYETEFECVASQTLNHSEGPITRLLLLDSYRNKFELFIQNGDLVRKTYELISIGCEQFNNPEFKIPVIVDKNFNIWARRGDRIYDTSKGGVYDLSGASFMLTTFAKVVGIEDDEKMIERFEEVCLTLEPDYLLWLKNLMDFERISSSLKEIRQR